MIDLVNFAAEVLAFVAILYAVAALNDWINDRIARRSAREIARRAILTQATVITFLDDDSDVIPLTLDDTTVALKAMLEAFQPTDRYTTTPDQFDAMKLAAAALEKSGGAA